MQRTGRKGYAQYRVVVQDSRVTPTSGRVVASLGTYNPHTKEATIDAEKAKQYLANGAQPSDRVALLFKKQGIELPSWVQAPSNKQKSIRNTEKLRKNQPIAEEEPVAEVVTETAEVAAE